MKTVEEQLDYLHKLRRMPERKLRKLYKKLFQRTRYYIRPTMDIARDYFESRIFYLYCVNFPCYKKGSPEYIVFRKRAKQVFLTPPYIKPQGTLLRERIGSRVLFTRANVARMPIEEVEAYLALWGFTIEGDVTDAEKRTALWEIYSSRATDLPHSVSADGKPKLLRRKRTRYNKYVLVDLILRFPKMGWPEFEATFAELMPNVTRRSFKNARYYVRQVYGQHVLPKLKSGVRKSKVKRGDYDLVERVEPELPNIEDLA